MASRVQIEQITAAKHQRVMRRGGWGVFVCLGLAIICLSGLTSYGQTEGQVEGQTKGQTTSQSADDKAAETAAIQTINPPAVTTPQTPASTGGQPDPTPATTTPEKNNETRSADNPTSPAPTIAQRLAARLINPQLDSHLRMAAAYDLIRLDTSAAASIIRQGLANHADAGTQRAILGALVRYPNPPRELVPVLLDTFEKADTSLMRDIAWALGRYDDHLLLRDLSAMAQSNKTPMQARLGSILTLGHQRTMSVARLLIKLIEPTEPEPIRQAAFESLALLASQPEFGNNLEKWRQWWDEHRLLTPARWDALLLTRFSQQAELSSREGQQAIERLVDTHKQLLRATSQEQRPALLLAMLQDPLEPIRQLAVDQLDQRARAGEPTSAELRQGLVDRLDDVSPLIRLAAVKLLRNLRDESGSRDRTAQAVAARLISLNETNEDVLRAYLLLLTDTPMPAAVDRTIDLLRSPSLREDAAGAIASAIDKQLVTDKNIELLTSMFDRLVPGDQPPEPKLIELLGRVGGSTVWERIEHWLDDPDERVRLASARAWANSDRSLEGLSQYLHVPSLQPIIIDAAYRRGRSVRTLMQLIAHKPQQEQLIQSWQAALVAMAGRLPPEAILQADNELGKHKESLSLRAAFVGAAITAMAEYQAVGPAESIAKPGGLASKARSVAVDVYLRNARLLLDNGSAESAMGQLNHIEKNYVTQNPLSDSQRFVMDQLRLEILSATGDLDRAIAQSDQILSRMAAWKEHDKLGVLESMSSLFVNWASRSVTTGQYDQANRILLYLRVHFQEILPDEVLPQLALLEARVNKVRNPAASQPSTNPASNPAAGSTNPATTPASNPASNPDTQSTDDDSTNSSSVNANPSYTSQPSAAATIETNNKPNQGSEGTSPSPTRPDNEAASVPTDE